jgi:hypothetical protein
MPKAPTPEAPYHVMAGLDPAIHAFSPATLSHPIFRFL